VENSQAQNFSTDPRSYILSIATITTPSFCWSGQDLQTNSNFGQLYQKQTNM